jgi:nicotianamine synthase
MDLIHQNFIRNLYQDLIKLQDYRPNKKVNNLFTKLVQYVLDPENKNYFTKKEIIKLQKICQLAEYELEKYWAQKIIKSKNAQILIKNFPYFDNYKKLIQLEWFSLLSCTNHKTHNICFIGGGPLPLTPIILVKKYAKTVTILDKNSEACKISRQLIKKLKLNKKIKIIEVNACNYNDFKKFNVIIIASLVGTKKLEKEKILLKIKRNSLKETHILARSSWGMRELLYKPLDNKVYQIFSPIMEILPKNDVINSIVILKNK